MASWQHNLEALMVARGFNMKSLSLAAGLGETFVRDSLRRNRKPLMPNLEKLADTLGVSVAELLGEDKPYQVLPITGAVSAGESWVAFDDVIGELDMRADDGEAIVLEVRGNSMWPAYRDRDVLIGVKRYGRQLDSLSGQDCIVLTKAGERYLKFVAKALRFGRVNLKSYNPAFADIENVELEWAAPVIWVRRHQG